jgi:hypothetical protein
VTWYWWIPVGLVVWLLAAAIVGSIVGRAIAFGGREVARWGDEVGADGAMSEKVKQDETKRLYEEAIYGRP